MTDNADAADAFALREEPGRGFDVAALGLTVGEAALAAVAEGVAAVAEEQHVVARVVESRHQR